MKRTEWFGARGDELFIAQNVSRRYVAWWRWEGSSFGEDEMWLYKYDLKSKKCLWKKNIGPMSCDWYYRNCFITGDNKVYLCKHWHGLQVKTEVYDLATFKKIKVMDCWSGPTDAFGSYAYRESVKPFENTSWLHWAGNEKDAFIRDDDIQSMKKQKMDRVDFKKYEFQKTPPDGDWPATYVWRFYNQAHQSRKLIIVAEKERLHDNFMCSLIDEETGSEIDHLPTGMTGLNFGYYDDTIYHVDLFEEDGCLTFFRWNCLAHTTETIKLLVK